MRLPAVAALTAALAVTSSSPALAETPCAADLQRLCPDVKSGGGRVSRCLREHRSSLSPECRSEVDVEALAGRKAVERFGKACRSDVDDYCPSVEPGGGRVLGCLAQHLPTLTAPCQAELRRVTEARARVEAVRDACTAEVKELCEGVDPTAGQLLACLQANEARLSGRCSAAELRQAAEAAGVVDATEEMGRQDRVVEALQILQGIDSVAFSRSQVLLQYDSYQGLGGSANASRLLFNPQFVFGERGQFSFQVRVPVKTVYPWEGTGPPRSGLGEVTTAVSWNVGSHDQFRHYLSLGVQLETAPDRALGGPWSVQPAYAVAVGLSRWLSLTTQVVWIRSVAASSYPEVDTLILEPILVANLPGRSFLGLDTRLAWDLTNGAFTPLLKGIAGIFTDRRKSVSISTWYQAALTSAAAKRAYQFEVGLGLSFYFDW